MQITVTEIDANLIRDAIRSVLDSARIEALDGSPIDARTRERLLLAEIHDVVMEELSSRGYCLVDWGGEPILASDCSVFEEAVLSDSDLCLCEEPDCAQCSHRNEIAGAGLPDSRFEDDSCLPASDCWPDA
jgi:hypothetical protein